jgi:hypothetical protein
MGNSSLEFSSATFLPRTPLALAFSSISGEPNEIGYAKHLAPYVSKK